MKKLLITFAVTSMTFIAAAQNKLYSTKTGTAFFDAGTGVENISGTNKAVLSAFDPVSGNIQFQIKIKGFEFWSQLMQDHFNENYMESDKFPNATFNGKFTNINKVNFSKDGSYPVNVKGTMEIHGVKKEVETKATLTVAGESVKGVSEFVVIMKDFKINIPGVVKDKLATDAKVKIDCTYNLTKQ